MKYQVEFDEYLQENRDPFNILGNKEHREILTNILDSRSLERDLFTTSTIILEELTKLNKRSKLYRQWRKKDGEKTRILSVPHPLLEKFYSVYLVPLIKSFPVHQKAHGGERHWSPKKSLETHITCTQVLSFDLSNAFSNVTVCDVFDFFFSALVQFEGSTKRKLAGFLSMLTTVTYNDKRSLPQGSVHSMPLFNRILYQLDVSLDQVSRERGFNYTRWVDDLTISSLSQRSIEDFLGAIFLASYYFPVAEQKVFFQHSSKPIYLLGYVIESGIIRKNSREEKEQNKVAPINYKDWFGDVRKFKSWEVAS